MRFLVPVLFSLTTVLSAQALPTTGSLNGKYFVRHIQFSVDGANNATDARSIIGVIIFNGSGNYSFTGQQVIGGGAAAAFSASGIYSVDSTAIATLTNPQTPALTINARLGVEAVIGSSTEASTNTFDMFVAIPAPATPLSNASLKATFYGTDFELTAASTAQVRDAAITAALDGAGNITAFSLQGHAANLIGGATVSQTLTGGTYSVSADGSGSIAFPVPAGGAPALLGGTPRSIQVSQSGNIVLGGTPGAHDIFIAIKGHAAPVALTGRSWLTGLRVDSSGSSQDYAGSSTVIGADSSLIESKRVRESTFPTPLNLTAAQIYTLASDGTGSLGPGRIAVSDGGLVVANTGNQLDPTGYEITFGEPISSTSGAGVFITPGGVVNAASNAPAGDAISPGAYITIYGSGLGATAPAPAAPYPFLLGGTSVSINNLPAALSFVSAAQINCLVPYGLTGPAATVTVTSGGVVSNTVTVPVAKTSPGIFTVDGTGTGDGAIVHGSDGVSLVNAGNPAIKGEIVVLYLAGLGALTIPVADGHAATAVDNATTPLQILVSGVPVPPADVAYQGLSSYPGLYQINFKVPVNLSVGGELPLAIATPDAFTDEVNIAVR